MKVTAMASNYKSSPWPPKRAFALQKYLLLHSQRDALQKHLDHISTSLATSPGLSSPLSSTDSADSTLSLTKFYQLSSSQPSVLPSLPSSLLESTLEAIKEAQDKLRDVHLHIKTTLTKLLDCEGVIGDERYRLWIFSRLMDAERELGIGKISSVEEKVQMAGVTVRK